MTDTASPPASNTPEFSVSEISSVLKRTVEQNFSHVRVRGEISGFKRAASGHLYMALKDDRAVIDGVCWRGTAQKLSVQPEDGLEVIATGKLTTYPGRSKYQIVIESMEMAGEGALLKLLEERKKKLEAEGLFDPARKNELPFLPKTIGVITSPTGAVIRDILHRLSDRFPCHVLLWPVLVQGDGAAEQVAKAIKGFNTQPDESRPDLIIVARGGGSLEDLWSFNEEIVVRAAAESALPLISAVGHETDTTLIDHAADRRAPTPTAAAEIAVPVRRDLIAGTLDLQRRMIGGWSRLAERAGMKLEGLARGLPTPGSLLDIASQSLDDQTERFENAMRNRLRQDKQRTMAMGDRLRSPRQHLTALQSQLDQLDDRGTTALTRHWGNEQRTFTNKQFDARLDNALQRRRRESRNILDQIGRRLESVSHRSVLKRGFAVVKDAQDRVVKAGASLSSGDRIAIEFGDGVPKQAVIEKNSPAAANTQNGNVKKPASKPTPEQGQLL